MILVRRGVCDRLLPPVSLVLAGDADGYVRGLTSYRYGDERDWCDFFSRAAIRAAETAELLARRVGDLQSRWLQAAGRPRARSAARALVEALPTRPVLASSTAQAIAGLSDEACRRALNRLEQAGVLAETTAGRRNRVWESVGLFDLLDRVDREAGDPRRVPARSH